MVGVALIVSLLTATHAHAGPREASGTVDLASASHCARAGELIGGNCSYTTGMTARRVVEEGAEWAFVGGLTPCTNDLESLVAVPFTANGHHIIANELVELLAAEGLTGAKFVLAGRLLEIDGVRYVVLTSYKVINT